MPIPRGNVHNGQDRHQLLPSRLRDRKARKATIAVNVNLIKLADLGGFVL